MIDFAKLSRPFESSKISWRIGSTNGEKSKGIALAYIDARDVMQRLDEVVGAGSWQCEYPWTADGKLCCRIGIKVDGEWVWKSNGAGDTQVEAEKGAFSDAFKRAAVLWGIGQYLYDFPNIWVEIKPKGKSYCIPENVEKDLTKKMEQWVAGKVVTPTEGDKKTEKTFDEVIAWADKHWDTRTVDDIIYNCGYTRITLGTVTEEHKEIIKADIKKKYEGENKKK